MQLEHADLHVRLRETRCEPRVVERAAIERQSPQLVDELGVNHELARVHASLVRERRVRDVPTGVLRADELVGRHEHVGEEHFVELGLVGDLTQRSHLDAGSVHVDDERGDPFALRRVGIGAREAPAPVGELRVARPDLLAVEEPAAVDRRRPGRERGQVAPRAGLAEELAPDLRRVEDLREPARLLLGRAVREQRRADEVHADAADELGARPRASSSVTM